MAPITDETVSGLKNTITQLEAKVVELEQRLVNGGEKPKSLTEQMRIILMGPPGAGRFSCNPTMANPTHGY